MSSLGAIYTHESRIGWGKLGENGKWRGPSLATAEPQSLRRRRGRRTIRRRLGALGPPVRGLTRAGRRDGIKLDRERGHDPLGLEGTDDGALSRADGRRGPRGGKRWRWLYACCDGWDSHGNGPGFGRHHSAQRTRRRGGPGAQVGLLPRCLDALGTPCCTEGVRLRLGRRVAPRAVSQGGPGHGCRVRAVVLDADRGDRVVMMEGAEGGAMRFGRGARP
jgi:hypothetical protein